jgi:hypothetical protein
MIKRPVGSGNRLLVGFQLAIYGYALCTSAAIERRSAMPIEVYRIQFAV